MANRFLNSIKINDAYTFPASDGANGQAIITDGAGNLSFGDVASGGSGSASVIYRDNFVGDGIETQFYLQRSLTTEDQSQIFLNGVYQEKDTYTVVDNLLTFSTAPASGYSVEVMSITGINTGPTTLYQDNFTGNGSSTTFTLANSINDEIKTMVFLNGVYQFKGTYSVSGTSLIFDAAPANGVAIEVITIASASSENSAQKVLFYGKATGAISKGDAVMFAGAQGDHFLIAKATQAALSANHEYILGLANQNFAVNEYGYVVEFGRVDAIDTSMYTAGDILWFDSEGTTAGAITNVQPTPPNTKIQLAAVIRSHQNEGVLFVRPTIYHELSELHDVSITNIADKDLLSWNNTLGVWENTKTLGNITTGNITTSGTVDGVDISSFKSSYDSHNHDDRYYTNIESDGRFLGISAKASDSNLLDGIDSSQFLRSDESDTMSGSLTANGVSSIGQEQAFTWQRTTGVASDIYSLNADSGSAYLYNNTTSDILMLWSEGGRVLINTTTDVGDPFNLQVNGRILQTGAEFLFSGDQDKSITVYNNRPLYLRTNDTTRVTILGGGDVGIGTTSPVSAANYIFTTTNGTNGSGYITQVNGTTSMYVYSISTESRISEQRALPLVFETNGSEKMRITSGGNVGIGTTTPNVNLEIVGTGVNVFSNIYSNFRNLNSKSAGQYKGVALGYDNSSNSGIIFPETYSSANSLVFYSYNGSWGERMRIHTNGYIGIGTTNPDKLIDVRAVNNATIRVGSSGHGGSGDEFGNLEFYWADPDAAGVKAKIYAKNVGNVGPGGGGAADLLFATETPFGSLTERIRITSDGTVIFSRPPMTSQASYTYQNLKVTSGFGSGYTNSRIQSLLAGYDGSIYGVDIGYSYDGGGVGNVGYSLRFSTNDDLTGYPIERLRINSIGNVGIGTTDPSDYKLRVVASGAAGFRVDTVGSTFGSPSINARNGSVDTIFSATSNGLEIGTWSNDDIIFKTVQSEKMRITTGGYVITSAQPRFYARHTTGEILQSTTIIYETVALNQGNCYNSSNGRFTAPINGHYRFTWNSIGGQTGDVYRYSIRVNNGDWQEAQLRVDSTASGTEYANGERTAIIPLASGDYVTIFFNSDGGSSSYGSGGYVSFMGELIG